MINNFDYQYYYYYYASMYDYENKEQYVSENN